ncbi:MAG: hypothetical protein ACE37D_12860 [Pseudomonadales bacterium]
MNRIHILVLVCLVLFAPFAAAEESNVLQTLAENPERFGIAAITHTEDPNGGGGTYSVTMQILFIMNDFSEC